MTDTLQKTLGELARELGRDLERTSPTDTDRIMLAIEKAALVGEWRAQEGNPGHHVYRVTPLLRSAEARDEGPREIDSRGFYSSALGEPYEPPPAPDDGTTKEPPNSP